MSLTRRASLEPPRSPHRAHNQRGANDHHRKLRRPIDLDEVGRPKGDLCIGVRLHELPAHAQVELLRAIALPENQVLAEVAVRTVPSGGVFKHDRLASGGFVALPLAVPQLHVPGQHIHAVDGLVGPAAAVAVRTAVCDPIAEADGLHSGFDKHGHVVVRLALERPHLLPQPTIAGLGRARTLAHDDGGASRHLQAQRLAILERLAFMHR
mmetsp:Transcript_44177/g.127577  ORF Transcript_44177/g.127577 Transcript_44177/m.127577 type:complete len:210 (-) Transcript_44177:977-1606(-)